MYKICYCNGGALLGGDSAEKIFAELGFGSKLPFTDMAHMELNIDFNLEKSRALIWVFLYDFECEICAKSEHCSGF